MIPQYEVIFSSLYVVDSMGICQIQRFDYQTTNPTV